MNAPPLIEFLGTHLPVEYYYPLHFTSCSHGFPASDTIIRHTITINIVLYAIFIAHRAIMDYTEMRGDHKRILSN